MTRRDKACDAAYRAQYAAFAGVLRQAVAEGRQLSEAGLHRRLGITMPPSGAKI